MAYEILMPSLSPTMKEGTIIKWHKKEGDVIKASDLLLDIETDKAVMEVEAVDEGILRKIFFDSGIIKVGTLVGVIAETDEDISVFLNRKDDIAVTTEILNETSKITEEKLFDNISNNQQTVSNITLSKIIISPLAKKLSQKFNIDISLIKGSGPKGRIIKKDIEGFKITKFDKKEDQKPLYLKSTPLSNMQKVIAKRLLESKQTIPHFYLSIDILIDELIKLKNQIEEKISINDFVIKACAIALQKVPEINVSLEGDMLIQHQTSDISVAVSIESGLITPIVKNAEAKSILNISNEVKELVKKAKDGILKPTEFQGGTFTISNLGMYKIDSFQAIINPPQSAILAVGAGIKKPVVINEEIQIKTVMNVTMSLDHRVIGGKEASVFLNVLKDLIEKPYKILL